MILIWETSKEEIIIADTSGLVSLFLPDDQNNHEVACRLLGTCKVRTKISSFLRMCSLIPQYPRAQGRSLGSVGRSCRVNPAVPGLREQSRVTQALKKFEAVPQAVSFTDCLVMAVADEYATLTSLALTSSLRMRDIADSNQHPPLASPLICR